MLVHAAAGALGLMAVQIAKSVGCKVIGTVGSKEKMEVARGFGVDEGVDYVEDGEGWWERILEMTEGKGVDVVFDSVGLVVSFPITSRCGIWDRIQCLDDCVSGLTKSVGLTSPGQELEVPQAKR